MPQKKLRNIKGPAMTGKEFHQWVLRSKPGESCTYFVGLLGKDRRIQDGSAGDVALRAAGYEFGPTPHISNNSYIWRQIHEPLVDLVQKRLSKDCCAYIAQKRMSAMYLTHSKV